MRVVEDLAELLATYICPGAPFMFPPGREPRPWRDRVAWQGHGVLMLQRPGRARAISVFWNGPEREFAGWYVNFQEPFRRTERGFDTQDLDCDIWIPAQQGLGMEGCRHLRAARRRRPLTRRRSRRPGSRAAASPPSLDAGSRWSGSILELWEPDPAWDAHYEKMPA